MWTWIERRWCGGAAAVLGIALLVVAVAGVASADAPAEEDGAAAEVEVALELDTTPTFRTWRGHLHQKTFQASLGWLVPSAILTGMGRAAMIFDASYQLETVAPVGLITIGVTGFCVLASELALATIDNRIDLAADLFEFSDDVARSGWGLFGLSWASLLTGAAMVLPAVVIPGLAFMPIAHGVGFFALGVAAITCWIAAGEADQLGRDGVAVGLAPRPQFRIVSASPLGFSAVW